MHWLQSDNKGTQVAPQDRLSDHVYQYDNETREVFRADRAEEHQQKMDIIMDTRDIVFSPVAIILFLILISVRLLQLLNMIVISRPHSIRN